MASPNCKVCGSKMMKNGTTTAGTQRWRCGRCGSSAVRKIDSTAKWLGTFVKWLLGKSAQSELGMNPRYFRKRTSAFWSLWPILPICDEVHHAIYMDGIWLSRKCVILIACTDDFIIGCHLARSENSKDWACLMQRIAPPDVLVCDGGGGIEKARRAIWPTTRVQRCTFHAFCQVRRCTTTRPKTQAGIDIYAIAKDLMHIGSQQEALEWLARFNRWCEDYDSFLRERSEDGSGYKHEKLRKARRGLVKLCREGTLFTYLEEELVADGAIPAMSNMVENVNGRIRRMLEFHRGMNIEHRIKAVFWFSYMKSEAPIPFAEMLKRFPDDQKVLEWRSAAARANGNDGEMPARWGEGIVWSELHQQTPYPWAID